MTRRPMSKWLMVWSVISLLVLVVLLVGCFGTFGVTVSNSRGLNGTVTDSAEIALNAGRVRIFTSTTVTSNGTYPHGPSLRWDGYRPDLPDIKRMVWEFDAHPLTLPSGQVFLFAFPIWMIALPCLIAPAIYLRRRFKKRPEFEGFAVVELGRTSAAG